ISHLNAQPNPGIQFRFRQFAHVTFTHPVVSEQTTRRSDPYLGFWNPRVACSDHLPWISHLNAQPKSGIQFGCCQFAHVNFTYPVMSE
ncbi:hypothetical protein Taro_022139, partial [Colocasia esculenta]|nr:hypothetical protein [Colocasia esculenta]